ncbi:MAG: DUF192 domain-containing protein [Planctomycetota bacterium]
MAARLILTLLALLCVVSPLIGCDSASSAGDAELVRVSVTDDTGTKHRFSLEPALDDATRVLGLSHRDEIAADGGMAFFFTTARQQNFVMRHCPIPIDIVYVDGSGRVVSHHAMVPEKPQGENESEAAYNRRLRRYPSRFAVPIVLEFQGGTIERLGIEEGDVIDIDDLKGWRSRAR